MGSIMLPFVQMMKLLSPAKINLFLRILHRRKDNFHELASLFQTINLFDTISIVESDSDSLTCSHATIPLDGCNLVIRARDLFRQMTGYSTPLKFHIDKRIPIEAGLGGGSSNAATTLWAMNILSQLNLSTELLQQWSAQIGSDIPFFFSHGTAYCTGRGEIVRDLEPLSCDNLWLFKPNQGLSTAKIYEALEIDNLQDRHPEESLARHLSGYPEYYNDLEDVALQMMPELASFRNRLMQMGVKTVLMCGSGSAFFCIGQPRTINFHPPFSCTAQFTHRKPGCWY